MVKEKKEGFWRIEDMDTKPGITQKDIDEARKKAKKSIAELNKRIAAKKSKKFRR